MAMVTKNGQVVAKFTTVEAAIDCAKGLDDDMALRHKNDLIMVEVGKRTFWSNFWLG